jgi:1,2-alpha-glucosylglycerol phosphorylase
MPDLQNNLRTIDGWQIIEKTFDPDSIVTTGSNFMIGNGYLGYRGTFAEWKQEHYVACTVTDTWDTAPGSEWRELCTVPNGLFTQVWVDDEMLSAFAGETSEYHRELDLHYGLNRRSCIWKAQSGKRIRIQVEKFASYDNVHLVPMRLSIKALDPMEIKLLAGIDGRIWSLNGDHFKDTDLFSKGDYVGIENHTYEFNIQVEVVCGLKISGTEPSETTIIKEDQRILQEFTFQLEAGAEAALDQTMVVYHSNDVPKPRQTAIADVNKAIETGFDALFQAHQPHWDRIWEASDIQIGGDLEAQTLARFNLYQATIATPTHAKLPIGARGLSCQVYQGAAFWDQETFNLPMYLYTRPEVARRIIEYRYDTLPGARKKAQDLGYYGAFYAWTSGKTGEELFPDYFFTDVLTGRKIHNHFNSWQIHISPDIVYALWYYFEASGDWDFILNYGAEIAFEVAQFLVSRVHFKMDKDRYEFIRLLGPDEYHENVDNNAYTNYLAQFSLEKAAYIFIRMAEENPQKLDALLEKIGLERDAVNAWMDMALKLYLHQPDPETKLIEQYDGFFNLEDITPEELRKRLIDPEEYWGWPNGIAVEAQALKQADVLQLFALLDDKFSPEVMRANYDYYEPRTEHGSSLSPSVHALVAAWADYPEEAYRYYFEASTIDLYNASKKVMSGGAFLGGIHTAAAGSVWQMIVKGFAGFKWVSGVLKFHPALPHDWDSIHFKLVVHGNWLNVTITHETLTLMTPPENATPIPYDIQGNKGAIAPGETLTI